MLFSISHPDANMQSLAKRTNYGKIYEPFIPINLNKAPAKHTRKMPKHTASHCRKILLRYAVTSPTQSVSPLVRLAAFKPGRPSRLCALFSARYLWFWDSQYCRFQQRVWNEHSLFHSVLGHFLVCPVAQGFAVEEAGLGLCVCGCEGRRGFVCGI